MNKHSRHRFIPTLAAAAVLATLTTGCVEAGASTKPSDSMAGQVQQLEAMAPYRGYLKAHDSVQKPLGLLGGPLKIHLSQPKGGVHVALPAYRQLDPQVLGTPDRPRKLNGFPIATGVPAKLRGEKDGQYTQLKTLSPFGDKSMVAGDGKLDVEATDATATDAATTQDTVRMTASWKDKAGNTYTVKCCNRMASHGADYPTFGGVVTNTILHGSSGVGTALMPTEYTYFAFWGIGEVLKNGKVVAKPRLVHGMLTEYVRGKNYALVSDDEVTPTRRHFHLIVPPVMPDLEHGTFKKSPVTTGFELANGQTLPFWHVMFQNLTINADRG